MNQNNNLDRDLFILGEPIETHFGSVRFLTYMEFIKYFVELNLISMNVLHLYHQYKKQSEVFPPEERADFLKAVEEVKVLSLQEFVTTDDRLVNAYATILNLVLDEESQHRIEEIINDAESFMGMRQLIMNMNFLTEDPVSDNPEIQEYYEDRKKMKQKNAGKQSPADIITSIVAGTSNSFDDVKKMTVIQVYSIYYRIAAFKEFDTQTLFATVSSDVKIESWSKNIDLFEKEELGIGYAAFNKQYGGLFD